MCTDLTVRPPDDVLHTAPVRPVLTHADVVNIIAAAIEHRDAYRYFEANSHGSMRRCRAQTALHDAVSGAGL